MHYFYRLPGSGALDLLNKALVCAARSICGRAEDPTAAIIDSQQKRAVYVASTLARKSRAAARGEHSGQGWRARRHWLRLCKLPDRHAHLRRSGYAGEKLETALAKINGPAIEIIKRPDDAKGFVIIARRWVVERTLAWINRCRRLAKDWEASIASSEAWLLIASVRQLSRRLARLAHIRLRQPY